MNYRISRILIQNVIELNVWDLSKRIGISVDTLIAQSLFDRCLCVCVTRMSVKVVGIGPLDQTA